MAVYTAIDAAPGPLDDLRFSRGQLLAVGLAVSIATLDGFDVQSMSFVAPALSKAWAINKASLGVVLGSSLFGMAGGAIGLSPLADVVGRRPVVLGGLMLVTLGALASALSTTIGALTASRVLTGLGIGVMVSLTTTLAAEFAGAPRRSLAVACTTVAFALGGVTGGLASAAILKAASWPWVFGAGAIAGLFLLIIVAAGMPESPVYLIDRRPRDAQPRLNAVLARLGRPAVLQMPEGDRPPRAAFAALFNPGMAGLTLSLALVFLLASTAAYYLLTWLPQLVADAGYSPATASLVVATTTLVGLPSGLVFGAFALRVGPMRLAALANIGFGLSLAALAFSPPTLAWLMPAAAAAGIFLQGSTAVFYATLAASFPPLMRVSGTGFVMGFGRLLSGFGPVLAGVLFAGGWTRTGVSLVFAGAAALGGLVLLALRRARGRS